MRKMLITLALVAGPVIAAAQTPTQTPDTSKAKPATQAPAADTTKKPN